MYSAERSAIATILIRIIIMLSTVILIEEFGVGYSLTRKGLTN